jgi:hypothetical protein
MAALTREETAEAGAEAEIERETIPRLARCPPMEEEIVKPATQAKQGRWDVPVFYVLVAGVALAVIAFAIIWTVHPW